ncbi:MAG TPA: monovalent cation/H(+) antiporter subunit G [Lacipirellulaceae bacterium]|nr:monovalent cation/H(+) antiporter subunit G [Lacipirellulaceae bacterium]HMP06681.1 monovalent cation/H(+) antiporter subunit G [Lacipirellulaceae bacterium]
MSEIGASVLLVVGGVFMMLAGVGVVRMPDLFMRMQAATKAATLGAACMLLGVAFHFEDLSVASRAIMVAAFLMLTAPVAAHVIARASYSVGVPLWEGTVVDALRDDRPDMEASATEEPN